MGPRKGDPAHQPTDVVTSSGQHHVQSIAHLTFEKAAAHAVAVFQVPDGRFDGLASLKQPDLRRGQRLLLAPVKDGDVFRLPASVAEIDDGGLGGNAGEDGGLLQMLLQGIAVIGVTGKAAGADDQTFLGCHRDADLDPELVGLASFALADAFHLGRMQGVELVLVLGFLAANALGAFKQDGEPLPLFVVGLDRKSVV